LCACPHKDKAKGQKNKTTRAEVPKLWGATPVDAVGPLGGGDLFVWGTFILNEIWTKDKIYFLIGTLFG
jgi:hypothetical protein